MITILPNSPIGTEEATLYLNDPNFDSRLFFTSTTASYNYIVGVSTVSGSTSIVTSGVLSGKGNNYRFDFGNYIKINNQTQPVLTALSTSGSYYFTGSNSCTVSLAIDTVDLLAANILNGNLTSALSGEISVAVGKTTANISCSNLFEYVMYDRITGNNLPTNSPQYIVNGTYYPITVNRSNDYIAYYVQDINDTVLDSALVTCTTGSNNDYTTAMVYIPESATQLKLYKYIDATFSVLTTIYTVVGCYTPYYFWNPNGAFDVLYCTGNSNEVDNVTKDSVKVGDTTVYTAMRTQKQIKQNTGFALTPTQIYGLISSPHVYTLVGSTLKEYEIDTTSFEGYNGVQYGSRNIQLTFTDPKTYKRKVNKTISFFD